MGKDLGIDADSKKVGNSGKVIVWGNDVGAVYSSISAADGKEAGDGGIVEISRPKSLFAKGQVDTRAE